MNDGELIRDGEDYVLRFERDLAYPVERVWRALTDRTDLAAWFPSQVDLELTVGGKVLFANDPSFEVDEELLAHTGEVVELDPKRRFAFTWGTDLLRFELSPRDGGCRLVFTHHLAHRAMVNRTVSGWSVCLDALDASLADAAPDSPGWRDYYDHYLAVYGDDGQVTRDGAATVVRFERLMPAPADAVWSELDGSPPYGGEGGKLGAVVRSSRPLVLEHDWAGDDGATGCVKWQLIPIGDTCLVLLTQTVDGDWDASQSLSAWDATLERLATKLA